MDNYSSSHVEITIEALDIQKMQEKGKEHFKFEKYISNQQKLKHNRSTRRLTGLQLPLHPMQVFGWIVLMFLGLVSFFYIIPSFVNKIQGPLYSLVSFLYIFHIVSHLGVLLIDPAEEEIRRFHRKDRVIPKLDRRKHWHVIENEYCNLCDIATTSKRTKHCSDCNKCISGFDHHCVWLNHCVGSRNYYAFLMCVGSAIVINLAIVAMTIGLIGIFVVDQNTSGNIPFLVFVGLISILASAVVIFLLNLFIFHMYICFHGVTTYEFNRLKIDEEAGRISVPIATEIQAPKPRRKMRTARIVVKNETSVQELVSIEQLVSSNSSVVREDVVPTALVKDEESPISIISNVRLTVTTYDLLENLIMLGLIAAFWRQHWKRILKNNH